MGTSKQTPIQVGRRKRKKSGGSRSVVVLVLALVAIIKKWNGAWHEKKKQTKIIEQGLTRVVAVVVRALTIKTPEKKNKMRQQLTLITINIEREKKNIKERVAKINVANLFLFLLCPLFLSS